jgi:mannose-6-phosphate isomerase
VNDALPGEDHTRPWGRFEVIADAAECKVKRITVLPGHRLSYQRHACRSEHWFLVGGAGVVTLDDATREVGVGSQVDVPVGTAHRIQCTSDDPIVFIEVQIGTYFGEDDIERLADDYGRAPHG